MIPITFIRESGAETEEVASVGWPQVPPTGTHVEIGNGRYEVIRSCWHESGIDTGGRKVMGAKVYVRLLT